MSDYGWLPRLRPVPLVTSRDGLPAAGARCPLPLARPLHPEKAEL